MIPDELRWDSEDSALFLNGGNLTNAMSTDQAPTVAEIIEAAKHMQARMEASRDRLELFILVMERCGLCRHKAKYIKPPNERIQFCRCRVAELKRQAAGVPNYMPDQLTPFPSFMGIEIETVGV